MKSHRVKDLMVPLEEYATVNENASLFEAIFELERIQARSFSISRATWAVASVQ